MNQDIVENRVEKGSASTLMSMVPTNEESGKKPTRKGRVKQACRNFAKMCRVRGGLSQRELYEQRLKKVMRVK